MTPFVALLSRRAAFRSLLAPLVCAVFVGCAPRQTASSPPVRLYAFDCGTIDVRDMSFFGGGHGEQRTLADPCFLVVHPKGRLLWDTGLPDELAQTPEGKPVMGFITFHVTHTLASQLAEIGVAPSAIQYLALSHMHVDHVGNASLVPRATLLLQREEYDAAFGANPSKYGFDPSTYATLRSNPVRTLQGDLDLFGDGTVVIKRAPGHTPGHQALFVKLRKTGNILLSGDAAHLTENWEHRRVPGFNYDSAQSVRTMDALAAFVEAQHATVWIQHDPTQSAGIKRAPAFYE